MKSILYTIYIAIILVVCSNKVAAQSLRIDNAFKKVQTVPTLPQKRLIVPSKSYLLQLDVSLLQQQLSMVLPSDNLHRLTAPIFTLPMPDGTTEEFHIWESSCMEKGLAAAYPMLKTYQGQGIQHPEAQLTIDISPYGFHALAYIGEKTVFIDPYAHLQTTYYTCYFKDDYPHPIGKELPCLVIDKDETALTPDRITHKHDASESLQYQNKAIQLVTGTELRSYRLALTCTGEYANFHSPTHNTAQVLAAMVTSINRVNSVYERDIAVHYNLVAENNLLVFHNAALDGFDNTNGGTLLGQNQSRTDSVIGKTKYDIGHIFSTGGGGVAQLSCVCSVSKAKGVTGSSNPIGDPFDIDYVVHEIGHQNGGKHTFNSEISSCNGNRSPGTAFEPGSGVTIMAYAGICGIDNLAPHSIDIFHTGSFDETVSFTQGNGNVCASISPSGNDTPICAASIVNATIPANTPFELTGTATDPNGDAMTYCWEQVDLSGVTPLIPTAGNGPVFRSYDPITSPTRSFPSLNTILTGVPERGNTLVSYARNYKFRMTVRDNHAGCGGSIYTPTVTVTSTAAAGPFVVTSQNNAGIVYPIGVRRLITWDVANTTASPINVANVNIFLSIDGGATFDTIAVNVPNTGNYQWLIPNRPSAQCRIKVKAATNIFFDINNANFTIEIGSPNYNLLTSDSLKGVCSPNSVSYIINTEAISGFSAPITFSASGVPTGATVTFMPTTVLPTETTMMTISINNTVLPDIYNLNVGASASGIVQNQLVRLQVASNIPAATTLLTPNDGALAISSNPNFAWVSVTDVSNYLIEIATDAGFTNVVATNSVTTTTANLTTTLQEGTTYYWRVKTINPCGSSYSDVQSFTTAYYVCKTYMAVAMPTDSISPSGASTLNLLLNVPDSFIVNDVDVVGINITHTWINDLTLNLKSPGTSPLNCSLLPQICDREDNLVNISFNDAATMSVTSAPCPPANIELEPNTPLSAFNGIDAQGSWTFVVNDVANNDGGRVHAWGLTFCSLQASPFIATEVEKQRVQKLVVYPNPTTNLVYVQLPTSLTKAQVNIYTMQGQQVSSMTTTNTAIFQTIDWAAGLYIVRVDSPEGLLVQKLVVAK